MTLSFLLTKLVDPLTPTNNMYLSLYYRMAPLLPRIRTGVGNTGCRYVGRAEQGDLLLYLFCH